MKVLRDGHEQELSVTLAELPDTQQVAKAEIESPDQPLAGLAVQELDRETAQELGLKGKIQESWSPMSTRKARRNGPV